MLEGWPGRNLSALPVLRRKYLQKEIGDKMCVSNETNPHCLLVLSYSHFLKVLHTQKEISNSKISHGSVR